MVEFCVPYGRGTMTVGIPAARVAGVLESQAAGLHEPGTALIEEALESPVGTPPLAELARGKQKVVVIAAGNTPLSGRVTLPPLLRGIRRGNPAAEITILVATGLRCAPVRKELMNWYGEEIVDRERIVVHDARDEGQLVALGRLPSGAEFLVNRLAVEADLLVAEGAIAPHLFAGFTGGPEVVLPGIAGRKTVMVSHSAPSIDSPWAQAGIRALNPIQKDMNWGARLVNLSFILNVVLNQAGEVIAAFAGNNEQAHRAGCRHLTRLVRVKPVFAEVVVTANGGYPLDRSLYQAVQGMYTGAKTIKPGGTIIIASSCCDGVGGEVFHRVLAEGRSPGAILRRLRSIPPERTIMDQWRLQIFLKILLECRIIVVTTGISPPVLSEMFLGHAVSLDEALDGVLKYHGEGAQVTVVPDGTAVLIG